MAGFYGGKLYKIPFYEHVLLQEDAEVRKHGGIQQWQIYNDNIIIIIVVLATQQL